MTFNEKHLALAALMQSFTEKRHNDVEFELSNGKLYASKAVLDARCEYFATMFREDSQFKENQSGVVNVPCTVNVMKIVLEFIYTGEINNFGDSEKGFKISDMAQSLNMMRMFLLENAYNGFQLELCKLMTTSIQKVIDISVSQKSSMSNSRLALKNLFQLLRVAHNLKLERFKETLHGVIADNYEKFLVCAETKCEIQKIEPRVFCDQMTNKYIPEKDAYRIKVYNLWVAKNKDKLTEEQKNEIKNSFNLYRFTTKFLLESVLDCNLFNRSEIVDVVKRRQEYEIEKAKKDVRESELSQKRKFFQEKKETEDQLKKLKMEKNNLIQTCEEVRESELSQKRKFLQEKKETEDQLKKLKMENNKLKATIQTYCTKYGNASISN